LKLIPGYDPTKPLYNGLHVIPVAPRTRLDIFQNAIRAYKTAIMGYWKALTIGAVPYDRESATGRIFSYI
jgi:hypothetical protein